MSSNYKNSLEKFFSNKPALLSGFYVVLGTGWGLTEDYSYLLIGFCLIIIQVFLKKKILFALLLFAFSFLYTSQTYTTPSSDHPISETVTFSLNSIHRSHSRFANRLYYRGTLLSSSSAKNIPILIFSKKKLNGDAIYQVEGALSKSSYGGWLFKINDTPTVVSSTLPIAKYRFVLKEKMRGWIKTHFSNARVEAFLSGLVTGEFYDPEFSWTFSRFGLQHIMAISGFHFSLVALMVSALLRFFFPRKITAALVLITLSSYFVFLGPTASTLRAWVMILIFFSGYLFEKKGEALNSLGIALVALSLYDPFLTLSAGFIFSFLITASILLFYPLFADYFRKKPLNELLEMDGLDQHSYIFYSWLRSGVALSIAVHVVALPLTLFFFQKFPLLSLLYNLFFPFFVAISLFIIFLSFLIWPLTPLLCMINTYWTSATLDLTFHLPTVFDIYIRSPKVPKSVVIIYFLVLFTTGAIWSEQRNPRKRLSLA